MRKAVILSELVSQKKRAIPSSLQNLPETNLLIWTMHRFYFPVRWINVKHFKIMTTNGRYRMVLGVFFLLISISSFWFPIRYVWPFAGRISAFIFGIIWSAIAFRVIYMAVKSKWYFEHKYFACQLGGDVVSTGGE